MSIKENNKIYTITLFPCPNGQFKLIYVIYDYNTELILNDDEAKKIMEEDLGVRFKALQNKAVSKYLNDLKRVICQQVFS